MTGMPTVSCDANGYWTDPFEWQHEGDFMARLHSSQSYEEFMLKSDLNNAQYSAEYFGFSCRAELMQFVKDYYASKEGFIQYGDE